MFALPNIGFAQLWVHRGRVGQAKEFRIESKNVFHELAYVPRQWVAVIAFQIAQIGSRLGKGLIILGWPIGVAYNWIFYSWIQIFMCERRFYIFAFEAYRF